MRVLANHERLLFANTLPNQVEASGTIIGAIRHPFWTILFHPAVLISVIIIGVFHFILFVYAIMELARVELTPSKRILWFLIITLFPIFGSIAFLLKRRKESKNNS